MISEQDVLLAKNNLAMLSRNSYPGRGIVAGVDDTSQFMIQVYWIMGRSENSRNRVFKKDGGRLYTEAADPSKVTDPSLIIYNAMRECGRHYIVSNGDQTDTVFERLHYPEPLQFVLEGRQYEPDAPNFTQRITAVSSLRSGLIQMSILRKSRFGLECDEANYRYRNCAGGFGFCITTYAEDGAPLPSFYGDPLLVPLVGNIDDVLLRYWRTLNKDNLISLAVKFIERENGVSEIAILNKCTQVQP